MEPALKMLVERLLWPIPRVRFEAARGLAALIRNRNEGARYILLDWMSKRNLESEVILALGLIDGFDLGAHFKFSDIVASIKAPSYLSDYLLKKNFSGVHNLFPFRFEISPAGPAALSGDQKAWFGRYKHAAVPPIFENTLVKLQQMSGWPFLERWEHDWCWLQLTHPRPMPQRPWYFFGSDREAVGQLDIGQREIYASAYLRTLAHAALQGPMPHEEAERYSLVALTMNRGLADLQPIPRPTWSSGLVGSSQDTETLSHRLWIDAATEVGPRETPLSLNLVDWNSEAFLRIDASLAIGIPGFVSKQLVPSELRERLVGWSTGDFSENFHDDIIPISTQIDPPLIAAQAIFPRWPGRFHSDIFESVKLASPYVFGPSRMLCTEYEIRLESDSGIMSRCLHWYADWAPTVPRELGSTVCSLTTIAVEDLTRIARDRRIEVGLWAHVSRGKRPDTLSDFEVQVQQFWLPTAYPPRL